MQQLWGKLDKYDEKKPTVLVKQAENICHQLQVAGEWESIRRHSHIALPDGGCSCRLQDIGLQNYKRRDILFLYNSILCISLKL